MLPAGYVNMKSSTSVTAEPPLPESGTALALTPAERSQLRARAHALHPVVMAGQAGLTEAVLRELDRALRAHELIKFKVAGGDRSARDAILAEVCMRLSAAPVQSIGRILVLYRPR